jgi:hypothetical protein
VGHPIPGFLVTTPYGKRGTSWSCDKIDGEGIHTGDDYSTHHEEGFTVQATASGRVVLVSQGGGGWGKAYGKHVVIETGELRHGYCHLSKIFVSVDQDVVAGERIAESGNTGNTKGPHLHYEERVSPFRFCVGRVKPTLNRGPRPGTSIKVGKVLLSHLQFGRTGSKSVKRLQDVLNGIALSGTVLAVTGDYDEATRDEVTNWQLQVGDSPEFADGNLGPLQADLLFARTGNRVVHDTGG